MTSRRTWWHLEDSKRKPSDYEIATSKLLYYPARGFEVRTPAGQWLLDRQRECSLELSDWELFRDPRETTYAKYVALQNTKEIFVDTLLRSVDETGYDQRLAPKWLETLNVVLAPLLYPAHGFQMAAAYLGHVAPSGCVVVTCAMQAADEMRRVQRLAYRIGQLQATHPELGQSGKSIWQEEPSWQPLRRAVERLLVTYEWGEAFVALNLVLKPSFDALFLLELGRLAERRGDEILAKLLGSLEEDTRWHREWARALIDLCLADTPANAQVLSKWVEKWRPISDAAIEPFGSLFEAEGAAVLALVQNARERCSAVVQRSVP